MSDKPNKVEFGISQLHVCTYETDDGGTVTLGEVYHQPGAVSFSPEDQGDLSSFFADNINYFSEYSDGNLEGDLEVALFSDDFKTKFLGYKKLANGGLAKVKGAYRPKVAIFFEVDGDKEHRRVALYNCALGPIGRSYNTETETREPVTETIPVTVTGDLETGVPIATFRPDDAGYDTLFTNPTAPEFESE